MQQGKHSSWQAAGSMVCLFAILITWGGHWAVLQSFAWARMIHKASQQQSLGSAISSAFNGKHPCNVCVAIEKGKSSEKKSDQQKPAGKIDCYILEQKLTLRGGAGFPAVTLARRVFDERREPPLLPPPRRA